MSRVIVIVSGKGGVGKTTTTINLGAAIKHIGGDVIIVDGNLSTPNIGVHLNSPEVPINLHHVLNNKADLIEAVYEHESGLKIIPASLSVQELKNIKIDRLKNIKDDLASLADYIIIDGAAGLGQEAIAAIQVADEIVIITNPEMPAITDALKTVKAAEQYKKPITGVIVARVRKNDIEMQPETVKEMLEIPVLGMIPEDINVSKALNTREAVTHTHPKSKSSKAYKELASKITGLPYDAREDKENIFEKIVNAFSRN